MASAPRRALARPQFVHVAWALLCLLAIWALTPPLWSALQPLPAPERVFHAGVLRVGLDPSRPPFASFSPDGQLIGLEIALAQALGETLNIDVQLVPLGFDGLYDALRTNRVDIVIAGLQPPAQPQIHAAVYSRHYFDGGLVLVSEQALTDMEALAGLRLAYEFGTPADELAQRWLRRIATFERQPYELPIYALDAVRLGVADAALIDALTLRQYQRTHPIWQPQSTQISHVWYTIVNRADRPDILRTVNHALKTLVNNGTLEALIEAWL